MANSPARSSIYSSRYEDFEAAYVGEEIADNYRYQIFHVKNTGEGYISYFYADGKLDYEFYAYAGEDDFFPTFENTVIGPNQEIDLKIKSSTALAVIDGNKLDYRASAYSNFVEGATVSGDRSVELLRETETYCYYSINATVENAPANTSIALVFKANYDGTDFYLKVDSYNKYRFYTTKPIDLNKLEIGDSVSILKSAENDYYYDGFGVIGEFLGTLLLIFIIVVFIVGNIIFLTIFLPKIIRKANQRKREKELKEKQNNENNNGE